MPVDKMGSLEIGAGKQKQRQAGDKHGSDDDEDDDEDEEEEEKAKQQQGYRGEDPGQLGTYMTTGGEKSYEIPFVTSAMYSEFEIR